MDQGYLSANYTPPHYVDTIPSTGQYFVGVNFGKSHNKHTNVGTQIDEHGNYYDAQGHPISHSDYSVINSII
jgi:hypothetical protein